MEASKIEKVSRLEIIEQLCDILEPWVSDISVVDGIGEETNLVADLGLGSIDILQLVLGIEREFSVSIENHELDSQLLSTMGNVVSMIKRKLHEAN